MQLRITIPDTVDEQIAAIDAQIAELQTKRDAAQRSRLLTCFHCKQQTVITELTYIQTYYYVEPYGCSDGDYWDEKEGQYECPSCGKINRLHDFQNHERTSEFKRYFGKVVNVRGH